METAQKPSAVKSKPFFKGDPVTSVVLLMVVFFFSQLLAIGLVSLYPAVRNWTDLESSAWLDSIVGTFLFMLIAEIIAIYATVQLTRLARVSVSKIGLVLPKLRDIGWAFIAYGLYFLVYLVVLGLVSQILPSIDLQQEQQIGFENAYETGEIIMTFLMLVVIVPLAEEIMFRGFLFSSLRAKYAFWPSVVVTGILFGAAHLQFGSNAPLLWVAAIDTFVLSCFLCFLREKLGSIWPAVGLHAIKNAVAFSILFAPRLFF